jgi:hypothetical protein
MSRRVWMFVGITAVVLLFAFLIAVNRLGNGSEPTPTPYPCPEATPELLAVEPVMSPTAEQTQAIFVTLGNGEEITVETASGTVTAPATFPTTEITIDLLPATVHELTVTGKVAKVQQGDCTYGGYTLTTTADRYGDPLVIVKE